MPGKEKRLLVLLFGFFLFSFLFFYSHLDNNDLLVGAEYRQFKSVQISLEICPFDTCHPHMSCWIKTPKLALLNQHFFHSLHIRPVLQHKESTVFFWNINKQNKIGVEVCRVILLYNVWKLLRHTGSHLNLNISLRRTPFDFRIPSSSRII